MIPSHKPRFCFLIIGGVLSCGAPLIAQEGPPASGAGARPVAAAPTGRLVPVSEKDVAWASQARKTYPLDVCVTSDEKLGSMGKSPEYIYRAEGQPDRLVVFCCAGCEEDFLKAPAKYLAKIDAAKRGQSAPKGEHKGHHE
jgi:hypothetical protein